ncbi:MAG: chorismate synthase [Candidatus Omnitrophota bacterium]
MAGSTFGKLFQITTFGESHGPAIGVVIDGVPPGLALTADDIQQDLDRRKPGQSEVTTQRKESDTAEILSGVFEGKTTGTPLAILIRNKDQRSRDYSNIKDVYRPGHADLTFEKKYGIRDYRGGGRSSGRETAARVAAGAVAKAVLRAGKVSVLAHTVQVGNVRADSFDPQQIEQNIVRCADADAAENMVRAIQAARDEQDSLGGIVEVRVSNCPAGLGDPVFDKLEARLAHAVMSIGAIKGIEFGAGFRAAELKGSQNNDTFKADNGSISISGTHAGGILGGISSGDPIMIRAAVKPPSSIGKAQKTVTRKGEQTEIAVTGRHDPCLCPRIVPVMEAMVNLVLADCLLIQHGLND